LIRVARPAGGPIPDPQAPGGCQNGEGTADRGSARLASVSAFRLTMLRIPRDGAHVSDGRAGRQGPDREGEVALETEAPRVR
jgi:hypothetical protein